MIQEVNRECPDQTAQIPRLIKAFDVRICPKTNQCMCAAPCENVLWAYFRQRNLRKPAHLHNLITIFTEDFANQIQVWFITLLYCNGIGLVYSLIAVDADEGRVLDISMQLSNVYCG